MNQRGKPRIELSRIDKVLLIRLRRMGDVIMTTPAIVALKEAIPQASLDYLVEAPFRTLVEGNPHLNQVIILPSKQSRRDFLDTAHRLKKGCYDVILDFHGGPRASWLTFLSGAALKVGYRTKFKSFIYDIKIDRGTGDGPVHSVENHVNLVRTLGVRVDSIPSLALPPPTPEEVGRIEEFFSRNALPGSRLAVLHIGAGNEFRDWGQDNLLRLISLLDKTPGLRTVLVGASEDKKREQALLSQGPPDLLSLVDRLNLRGLRELIRRADLFIGPDSGPMHVAASTDTPLVVYFGPTLPAHFSPWNAEAAILEKSLDCRPCRQRECLTGDFRCLLTISPEEVYAACLDKLEVNP